MSPNLAGLFFALDLVGYISTSFILGRYRQEEKDFKFIVWLSSFLAIFGLFFMGTIHTFGVPDSLYPFVIGTIIDGIAGALALNNGVACTVEHLREKFPGYGESINNTTSGIFMFYFSLGEMFGPILGSVLTSATGSFTSGIAIVDAGMLGWCILTLYFLGGFGIRGCKVVREQWHRKELKEPLIEDSDEKLSPEDEAKAKAND